MAELWLEAGWAQTEREHRDTQRETHTLREGRRWEQQSEMETGAEGMATRDRDRTEKGHGGDSNGGRKRDIDGDREKYMKRQK